MSARAVGALMRASWYQARSYRLQMVMQFGGMLFTVLPIYFVAGALQSTVARSIATESEQYFSFILVGTIAFLFVSTALNGLSSTISGSISSGYFESLLMTRTPVAWLFVGMTSYGMLLTVIRAVVILLAGWLLGAAVAWGQLASAFLIIVLLFAVHWGIGLIATALILAFRTAGMLTQVVTSVSILFGGVYYSTSAIPSWLGTIAQLTPLSYGLRALRRVLLLGNGLSTVASEVAMVAAMGVVSLIIGSWAVGLALRYARKQGTLSLY